MNEATPMDRRAAVAGTWYPDDPARLTAALETCLASAARGGTVVDNGPLVAIVVPHAGLIYSGPVAAHAYGLLRSRRFDVAVLVGPSHYVGFDGVSVWRRGRFQTPLGPLAVDEELAERLIQASDRVHERAAAHAREHSLEMQLPFLAHLAPGCRILPLVMGHQTRATAEALGDALASTLGDRRALLVASSDLSHFYDARTAARLDGEVLHSLERFDPEGLMRLLETRDDHACGGGPMVSVMRAARALGACESEVLRYADSGDVSGDKTSVVGYVAAALWGPGGAATKKRG